MPVCAILLFESRVSQLCVILLLIRHKYLRFTRAADASQLRKFPFLLIILPLLHKEVLLNDVRMHSDFIK